MLWNRLWWQELDIISTLTLHECVVTGHPDLLTCDSPAGQEDYDRLRPLSYQDADMVLVCYDVMNPTSFDNVTIKVLSWDRAADTWYMQSQSSFTQWSDREIERKREKIVTVCVWEGEKLKKGKRRPCTICYEIMCCSWLQKALAWDIFQWSGWLNHTRPRMIKGSYYKWS